MAEKLQCYCCEAEYEKGSDYDAGEIEAGVNWCTYCEEGSDEAELEEIEDDFLNAYDDEKVKLLLKLFKTLEPRDQKVFLNKLTA